METYLLETALIQKKSNKTHVQNISTAQTKFEFTITIQKIVPPRVCKVCDHFRPLKKIASGRLKIHIPGEPTGSLGGADLQHGPVT